MPRSYSAMRVSDDIVSLQIDNEYWNFEIEEARQFARQILKEVYSKKEGS